MEALNVSGHATPFWENDFHRNDGRRKHLNMKRLTTTNYVSW